MKLAIYKYLKDNTCGGTNIFEYSPFLDNEDGLFMRVSEVVDVEFTMLPPKDTVSREMAVIEAMEQELRGKFTDALAVLQDRRNKLLALTHQES